MSWDYHEKSTISSRISLPEKGLQTTQSTLLCACRFMTYECLPPLLIFLSPFIESHKYYLLVKQSQLLRVHPCLRLVLFNQVIITFQSSYNMITNRKLRLKKNCSEVFVLIKSFHHECSCLSCFLLFITQYKISVISCARVSVNYEIIYYMYSWQ